MKIVMSYFTDPSEFTTNEFEGNPLEKPLCGTGLSTCYVSPFGEVYPCIQFLFPMGNIRDKCFNDIWFAPSQLRDELTSLKTYNDLPICRTCTYVSVCRKCIGNAYLETGDMKQCYTNLQCLSQIDYELYQKGGSK